MIKNYSISELLKKLLKNYRVKNLHFATMKSFLSLIILLIRISNHLNKIQDFIRLKIIYYLLYIFKIIYIINISKNNLYYIILYKLIKIKNLFNYLFQVKN